MTPSELDVTVVVTCYNHQAFVEQCLESIAALPARPRQVIVVDDHSHDDSVAVIRHWLPAHGLPAEVIARDRNSGVCAAMNDALARAEGTFFRHISADDWLVPTAFEDHVRALEAADERVAFAVGDILETDGGGRTLASHDVGARLAGLQGADHAEDLHLALLRSNRVPAPGVVMRTEAVREVGGYDQSLVFEDYDMWLRLTARFGVVYVPETVAGYRVLASSLTRSSGASARFLDSELRSIEKHRGRSAAGDSIIDERARTLREQIAKAGDSLQTPSKSSRGTRRRASATMST